MTATYFNHTSRMHETIQISLALKQAKQLTLITHKERMKQFKSHRTKAGQT